MDSELTQWHDVTASPWQPIQADARQNQTSCFGQCKQTVFSNRRAPFPHLISKRSRRPSPSITLAHSPAVTSSHSLNINNKTSFILRPPPQNTFRCLHTQVSTYSYQKLIEQSLTFSFFVPADRHAHHTTHAYRSDPSSLSTPTL